MDTGQGCGGIFLEGLCSLPCTALQATGLEVWERLAVSSVVERLVLEPELHPPM